MHEAAGGGRFVFADAVRGSNNGRRRTLKEAAANLGARIPGGTSRANPWFNPCVPSPATIVRGRRERRLARRRSRDRLAYRGGVGLGIVASIALALLLLAGALAYADVTHDLPNVHYLPILLNPPDGLLLQPTRVYDRSGTHLLVTFAPTNGTRRYLPLNEAVPQHLPQALSEATVAVSDPGFWGHAGYVLRGWNEPSVHPTLAEKLVSDLLLYKEAPSLRRAVRERFLAAQATKEYGRTQILEWFLNSADYGNDAFGAEAAAQLYFGKAAADLTLAESATLAGIAAAPGIDPLAAPEPASQGRAQVIQAMLRQGMISPDQAVEALATPLQFASGREGKEATAPAFVHLVRSQLDQEFDRDRIERGGIMVTTTLDYDLQQEAACTTLAYARLLQGSQSSATDCPSAEGLPALPPQTLAPEASASSVILDPQTGEVLAAVGETEDGGESPSLASHDAGSLLDPFIYLTAFARGSGPGSMVWDIPGPEEEPSPGAHYQGPVRMRIALVNDLAAPQQTVMAQMGAEAIGRTETSFGLRPRSNTLLELAGAYGVFAAQGVRYGQPGPFTVLRVEGIDHVTWLDMAHPRAQAVLDAPLAYLMNNVLSDETAREPLLGHPNPLEIGRPAGAKVGQTSAGKDGWTVGYTPSRVVAVWIGAPSVDTPVARSPRIAAGLWSALMETAAQHEPAVGWSAPQGVTSVDVCDPSGLLPTNDCPSVVSEVFLTGNEPTQADTLYKTFAINRDTGYLATVYTPVQLVENRVFMVLPPEAQAWARWANVPVAPSSYDAIQAEPINPDVRITSPEAFAQVQGRVQIRGTAAGPDFESSRVLVGQGINPQAWVTVGEESIQPVDEGLLATWDTEGLSGLYAVQLQVIRSDQRVDTAIIQVTISGN
jgi:membrane peptidoglycan carboxypeptidase